MRRLIQCGTALLVGLTLLVPGSPTVAPVNASFPGPSGKIVWDNGDGVGEMGVGQIYLMNPDGSQEVALTPWGEKNHFPSWSADGTRIVFTSERDVNGGPEIYVMNADGSGQTRLTNVVGSDTEPTWSPDGTKIAFVRSDEIYVMNADGSGQVNITNNAAFDASPSWQPGGVRIAFFTNRDGNAEIYTMNADGSAPTNVSNTPMVGEGSPDWSPDGSKLAFSEGEEVWVMNADGSGRANLSNNPAWDGMPAWSPDGTNIAFSSLRDGNYEIYVMDADGSSPSRMTNSPHTAGSGADIAPSWQPHPACDLALATSGGTLVDDQLNVAVGQEFGVYGFGYPANADVTVDFYFVSYGQSFPPNVAHTDSNGDFASGVYFLPGSEGSWRVTGSASIPYCTDVVNVQVVTGHPFTDILYHSFEAEIAWLYQRGITTGCSATLFCPDATVTREQMASFLVRGLHLPPNPTDFFTDDETSIHEADINALAASGITTGCSATTFCPTATVTRGQMAAFLERALF